MDWQFAELEFTRLHAGSGLSSAIFCHPEYAEYLFFIFNVVLNILTIWWFFYGLEFPPWTWHVASPVLDCYLSSGIFYYFYHLEYAEYLFFIFQCCSQKFDFFYGPEFPELEFPRPGMWLVWFHTVIQHFYHPEYTEYIFFNVIFNILAIWWFLWTGIFWTEPAFSFFNILSPGVYKILNFHFSSSFLLIYLHFDVLAIAELPFSGHSPDMSCSCVDILQQQYALQHWVVPPVKC